MIHWLIPTPRPTLLVLTQFGVVRLPERLRDEAQRLGRADLQLQELVRDQFAVSLGQVQLRDAGVGPERLLALVQVLHLPRVDRKAQQVKIKGLEQVVAALFVIHVHVVDDLDGPLCGVASLARRRDEGVRHC